jgi:nucleotide-binding universal stress UspA family protein
MNGAILIGYDGSDAAAHAISAAGRLFPGEEVAVVTLWSSIRSAARSARLALPNDMIARGVDNLDEAAIDEARMTAEAGARQASAAGLQAVASPVCAKGSAWQALLDEADARDARVIIVGSRGRSQIRAALLGSVATGVLNHSRRPVLVVPGAGESEPAR